MPGGDTIFLIGFMGSGKTTLGHALASRMPGWRFIDLDEEIERRESLSIADIFAKYGEATFRDIEADTLRALATHSHPDTTLLIATGGGTPCREGAMEWMNDHGLTVLLEASADRLLHRLVQAQSQRPLLRGKTPRQIGEFIISEQQRRAVYYDKASIRFPSDLLETREEIEDTCLRFIKEYHDIRHAL